MKFRFPIIIIDEDWRSDSASGLGIRALANGSLVYAVNERRKDIWLSRPAQERSRR